MIRTHTCGELCKNDSGKEVTLAGFVDSIRISGKIGFLDLRDRHGKTQVFLGKDLVPECKDLKQEDVIQIIGEVKSRPENQVKEKGTGEIELKAKQVNILNKIPELPLDLSGEVESTEEIRLKYRFLDLRRKDMQESMLIRYKLSKAIRDFLDKEDFMEMETPILGKSTPEGARDYLVPSRVNKNSFYALPQSPQVFKQLLMIAGFDKYFQIAKCFRDEDLRADRQPEFTQLDMEMSFVEEEDIFLVIEKLMQYVFKEVLDKEIKIPFQRKTYKEVMEKYNSDKPDLRKETNEEFAFLWVTEFPMFEYSEEKQKYLAMHHPFTSPKMEDLKFLEEDKSKVSSRGYDLVVNGYELGGGSIRIHEEEVQNKVFKALGLSQNEANEKFGFLLNALKFAPPHGGIAFGLDRWAMIMANKENIREVIAFPKNKDAKDLMLDAPSNVDKEQMKELGLKND